VPVLFVATVLGLLGGADLALGLGDGTEPMPAPVFGAAAAVTAVLHSGVAWGRHDRLRRAARGYPVLVLAAGVALSWLTLPDLVGMAIGGPAAVAAMSLCVWERSDYRLSSEAGA
jgi:hypothetical protein